MTAGSISLSSGESGWWQMRLSDLEGLVLVSARGKRVGWLARALFDEEQPVLVGFEVRMRPLGYLIERQRRYVPRSAVELSAREAALVRGSRLERIGGGRSRIDWERVVIWSGMPVRTASGVDLGAVREAELDGEGRIARIVLTRGATSDVAVGVREIDGAFVLGFADGAVRLDDEVARPEFSGGLAASAGKGAAAAKVAAERSAKGAVSAAIVAARAAKHSSLAKRASSSWKGFAAGVKEGMTDEPGADDR